MKPNSDSKGGLRERCYSHSINVIKFISSLPEKRVYRAISDQLLRSATSIGANITEGKGASSRKDFTNYYCIALKSANETAYWMGLLKDGLAVDDPELQSLKKETEELTRIIAASLVTLKAKS